MFDNFGFNEIFDFYYYEARKMRFETGNSKMKKSRGIQNKGHKSKIISIIRNKSKYAKKSRKKNRGRL